MTDTAALQALERWQLEPIVSVHRATSGTMNEVFIVTTTQRKVVLRRHRLSDRTQVDLEHAVIRHAIQHQIPTPSAIPSPAGEFVVQHEGTYYSLFIHAVGDHVGFDDLSTAHAQSMGAMLARLHDALADFPAKDTVAPTDATDSAAIVDAINSLIERIDRVQHPTEQDAWARHHLQTKASWIATHPIPARQQTPADPIQMVHGDYLHPNLFFTGTDVSAVIDWDKAEARWPVDEVIRAFDLSLQMRPDLCSAMVDGYRSVRPLALEDLDRSANDRFLGIVRSQWLFDGIYAGSNDRLREFLEPGPFIPFTDRWARLHVQLC